VWVRESRKKYYEAESDLWKVVKNVLGGRELRDIDRALNVLEANINRLRETMPTMDADLKQIARHYIGRIDALSDFFRLARLLLTSLLQQGLTFELNGMKDHPSDKPEK
jgi:DNA-binding transcriptional regulator GbsR (MarR family)